MRLYNTMTQKVEPFEPRGGKVSIYVCGITPYDTTHLGHAFTYTNTDVLVRYLELRGVKVDYVQNVTDIDDDILRKAKESGENWRDLGNRWTRHFIQDMQALNVRAPDHYVRATDAIPGIVEYVLRLVNDGLGYASGGNVYYSIDADREFGKLSKLSRSEMLPVANERGNHPDDPHKRDPLDFVLWQAQAPGEPAWPSPWGPGRPGWHIECSTLSTQYLGDTLDIHGGGADLCFPHHECEIAQVEPVTGQEPFVRFWMHTAMVYHDGEKMSKSLGNLVMVRDLLQTTPVDALRLYLSSHHYRENWSFDEGELKTFHKLAGKIREAVTAPSGRGLRLESEAAWGAFTNDMDNDLDTSATIQDLDAFAGSILEASLAGRDVKEAQEALRQFSTVFGLRLDDAKANIHAMNGWNRHLENFQY